MTQKQKRLIGKIILFGLIGLIPISFLYLFSSGKQNFEPPSYFGPKQAIIKDGKPTGDSTHYTIPDFNMYMLDGDTLQPSDFDGKIIVALVTGSSCPADCEMQAESIRRIVLKEIKDNDSYDDVVILSEFVHYDSDEQPVRNDLHSYFDEIRDPEQWQFFTCEVNEFYDYPAVPGQPNMYRHTAAGGRDGKGYYSLGILVDKEKHVRGIYNINNSAYIRDLLDGIKLLKKAEDYASN